jgi:putative CocE/NonD family hydrolase
MDFTCDAGEKGASAAMVAKLAKRMASPAAAWLPSTTADRAAEGARLRDIMVPMRGGTRLATDVYLPTTPPPYHTVLTRMPYGKSEPYCFMPAIGEFFNRKGYAFVVQDVRGKWGSEGVFEPNKTANEIPDGYDTIDWIGRQDWSNRRVGMWGESYFGFTAYAAAAAEHPALCCIAPGNITVDRYRATFRGGALQLNTVGVWAIQIAAREYQDLQAPDLWHLPLAEVANAARVPSAYFDQLMVNPVPSPFWRSRGLVDLLDTIDIPVLHWSGWYDCYLGETIADWRRLHARADGPTNYLFVGPWDHEASADALARVGRIEIDVDVAAHRWDTFQRFFDRHLMQIENGFGDEGAVHRYVMGASTWRDSSDWPPPEAKARRYHLCSAGFANTLNGDGRLSLDSPDADACDGFVYDPLHPIADTTEIDCWAIAAQRPDRRSVEARSDVLCYTTEPFVEPLEIAGPITLQLCASSSAVETDFTAALVDVYPDGTCDSIQDGILRTSYRDPTRAPEAIEPGRVYHFTIDLWSQSYVVKSGHRLRLEISSSAFSRYDRNCNTGEAFGQATRPISAVQTIYHTAEFPSFLEIYVHG